MIENVINNSSIWDLHIHSCKSPKSSGNFQKMDVDSFIDKLLLIFKDYPDLNLISFTDHNSISHEVYETFIKKEKNIQIIPGIEIDVEIDGVKNAKHMLFYFNISIEQLKTFSKDINAFLCGKDSVPLNSILEFIVERKVEFLISPHAFKQGKRGINFDWTQEEITNKNMHKYMDQFFCFWEAAGHSDIAKAEQFLKSFDQEEKISIISFSDSSDEEKLREYLDNPPQYFKSLPNYKGLQLVGTDCRRILKEKKKLDYDNTGNFIGSISINGKNINMSDQLNVIVGGRGSGKSVLLDNIALNLDSDIRNKNRIDKKRIEYLDKININVMNFDKSKVRIDSKKIDYFDQSYISKIFNSDDTSKAMAEYFMDEFANLDDKEGLIKIQNLKERYIENIQTTISSKPITNISNLVGKYKLIDDKKIDIKIKKTDIQKLKQINYSIDDAIKYANNGNKMIPSELRNNENVKNALNEFLKVVINEISSYNKQNIDDYLIDILRQEFLRYSETKSQDLKEKNIIEDILINHLKYEFEPYVQRTSIVNSIIDLQNNYEKNYCTSIERDGIKGSKFKFEKKISFEEPLEYFRKICVIYMGTSCKECDYSSLFKSFVYGINDLIKDSKNIDEMMDTLLNFKKYDIQKKNTIYYKSKDGEYENIDVMSPGTQTNILMEYIVSKDSKIPLLIDQPEDNIDNQTIYTKLTEWFNDLKKKRQVFVVTHDANIVINADAENVIIASKNGSNGFNYTNGALEYSDILEKISVILDGGIEAVERRLKKYGREKNNGNN